jgi:hypothetical protein
MSSSGYVLPEGAEEQVETSGGSLLLGKSDARKWWDVSAQEPQKSHGLGPRILDLVRDGAAPKPIKDGAKCSGEKWLVDSIKHCK